MQCTCPKYNASYSSLNRRNVHRQHQQNHQPYSGPNHKAPSAGGGVKWYSSQTLPNPKRRHHRDLFSSCPCNSSSCVFSSTALRRGERLPRRNAIDPRSGNPVKSCLNLSSTSASRNSCYLCSRSDSLRRRHREENPPPTHAQGPYLVSNSEFVAPQPQPQPLSNNFYASNKSVNSCPSYFSTADP